MPILRWAAVAATLFACANPASADTIGKEVKLSRAEIATGQIVVDGKGRSSQFYRLVSSTGAVLGTPYKSKPAGYFWISGGAVHPGSCTIGLQTSPTNTATSKWKAVTGGILLGNCHTGSALAGVIKVTKTCSSEKPGDWIETIDGATNQPVTVCHVACPEGTTPLSATETIRADNGPDEEFDFDFHHIEMGAFFENGRMQRALGLTDARQFLATIPFNPDPGWPTTYTLTALCEPN